jgi:streptogramin lyase
VVKLQLKSDEDLRLGLILSLFVMLLLIANSRIPIANSTGLSSSNALLVSNNTRSTQYFTPNMISNYSLPTPNAGPNSIVEGRNGTFWIAEFSAGNGEGPGKIAEFLSSNQTFREFKIPENGSVPNSIAIDQFGTVWFSDFTDKALWSLNGISGVFMKYPIPTKTAQPLFIIVDSNHNIWFTETTGYKIGELGYPTYSLTEYSVPVTKYEPLEMYLDSNTSTLWITLAKTTSEVQPGLIATFNTVTKKFENVYTPSVSLQDPVGIVLDKVGNVWISEHRGSSVVEFIPRNSTWRKFETSPPSGFYQTTISAVATIAIDKQGYLWFIEHFGNKVGRLDPTDGVIDEFDLTGTDDPFSVLDTIDSNGNFWLTNFGQNAIQMIPATASTGIYIRAISRNESISSYPRVTAGQALDITYEVENLASSDRTLTLNATSSFSASGYTNPEEVSFNITGDVLHLASNESAFVQAKITPDINLQSGLYSVSVSAIGQNSSSVQVFFFYVNASPLYFFYHIGDYLQEVLIVAIAVLATLFVLIRRRNRFKI